MSSPRPIAIVYVYRIARLVVTGVVAIFLFHYSYLAISSLSGEETTASIKLAFSLVRRTHLPAILVGMVGVGGLIYGIVQHLLRIRKTRRLSRRIKKLERLIDEGRQSSEPQEGD